MTARASDGLQTGAHLGRAVDDEQAWAGQAPQDRPTGGAIGPQCLEVACRTRHHDEPFRAGGGAWGWLGRGDSEGWPDEQGDERQTGEPEATDPRKADMKRSAGHVYLV